jgi:hypothetical protein
MWKYYDQHLTGITPIFSQTENNMANARNSPDGMTTDKRNYTANKSYGKN